MDKKRFTLDLTDAQLCMLRDVAKDAGHTIGRGPFASQGSVQKLIDSVVAARLEHDNDYVILICRGGIVDDCGGGND